MSRVAEVLVRQRWLLFVLPLGVGAVLVVPSGDGRSVVGLAVWGVILVAAVAVLAANLSGFDPGAEEVTAGVDLTPLGRALLVRWLSRSRYARFVGGAAGLVLGVGFGDGDLGPAVLGLLTGIAVGGALAEVHALTRRRSSPRSAELTVRRVADYVPGIDRLAVAAVAALAVAVAVTATIVDTRTSAVATRFAATALVVALSTAAMQHAVVIRQRPAVAPDLRSADDLLRGLAAAQGFTRPAIALGTALLAESLVSFGARWTAGAFVLWILGLGWYAASWRTRAAIAGRREAIR